MIRKLVKTKSTYHLVVNDKIIASVGDSDGKLQKLSLKNCQEIKCGYDLDDFAYEWVFEKNRHRWSNNDNTVGDNYESFKAGFQKALEIIDGKKFSKEDMQICRLQTELQLLNKYYERIGLDADVEIEETLEQLKSIQQTEWDVEIEMEEVYDGLDDMAQPQYAKRPKLDADGCLILKRKKNERDFN